MLTKTELEIVTEAVDSILYELEHGDISEYVVDELKCAYYILKEAQEKSLIEKEEE